MVDVPKDSVCTQCDQQASCLLVDLDRHEFRQAAQHIRHFSFQAGETLWQEGLYNPGAYIVCQGRAVLLVRNLEGKQRLVSLLDSTDVIYHERVRQTGAHSAHMESLESGYLGFIPDEDFRELALDYASIWMRLIEKITDHQVTLMHEVGAAAYEDVQARVSRALLKLDNAGFLDKGYFSQQLIADLAGTSRESVNRTLQALEEQGILENHETQVDILDPSRLTPLASPF